MLARADAWLGGVRDRLTPGQRWTASLSVLVALAVLLFGLPTAITTRTSGGRAEAAPHPIARMQTTAAVTSAATPVATSVTFSGSLPDTRPGLSGAPAVPAPATAPAASVAGPGQALPKVVALARPGGGPPGDDDAATASAYLRTAPFRSTLLTLAPNDPTMCHRTLAAGSVVLASGDIGPSLRACLLAGGATVLAADPEGDLLRRGTTQVLTDLARWPGLKGRIGLVAPADQRAAVEAALPALHPAAVAWLDPDPAGVREVVSAVEGFSTKGVTTTVFAVPVAQQQRWLVQAALLDPAMRYVVTDVSDGIVDEDYPPTFDGALAYTSLRTPWYERAHGDTPVQAACKQRWSAAAPPGLTTSTELADAYAWCVAVAATSAGLGVLGRSSSFGQAVRSVAVPSPLTSDLGPLPGGGFGPTEDAVLAWSARCICWTEDKPFRARP